MTYYHRVILYFDGASRHNPHGPAGCGWVLYEMDRHGAKDDHIAEDGVYLGHNVSNNQAEYEGLERGLQYVLDYINCDTLYVRGDSEIIIRQMTGEHQVRSPNIRGYYQDAKNVLDRLEYECDVVFRHIPRHDNWEADLLANNAIDNGY